MSEIVDARGLSCPQPVILARRALAQSTAVTVIVDNATARENVERMARSLGHPVQVEERADGRYGNIPSGDARPPGGDDAIGGKNG